MFFKYDLDRSGSLEKREVHAAIRSLGIDDSYAMPWIMMHVCIQAILSVKKPSAFYLIVLPNEDST